MKIHLVTHTHWDREWYRTYQEFRIFLVRLLDEFLDYIKREPDYSSFMLDGQTVELEDYLEVRSERFEELKHAVKLGKLIIGPMYIQPDEFVPSGEALVRNFLIGKKVAERFGSSMQVGYFPDSFGHCAQMPQILRGMGLDSVVLWRGLCDEDTQKTEFLWEGSDGSKVFVIWMPFSYGNAHLLNINTKNITQTVNQAIDDLGSMATTEHILLMKGWDHSGFSPSVPNIIQEAKKQLPNDIQMVHGNLETLIQEIKADKPDLKILQGEFRKPKTMRIHAGITSTRMDIKQAMVRSQRQIEKFSEPMSVISWLVGREYPREILTQAWKYVLQSQAHDSIGCCCTDEALRSVKKRFEDADEISNAVYRQESMAFSEAIQTDQQPGTPFIVINLLPSPRQEVCQGMLLVPKEDFFLQKRDGSGIPFQILDKEVVYLGLDPSVSLMQKTVERTEEILEAVGQRPDDPAIYYDQNTYVPLSERAEGIKAFRVSVAFPVDCVEAFGYETYFVSDGNKKQNFETDLVCTTHSMENPYLKITIARDGSFELLDKETGHSYHDLLVFEDSGDEGDEYNFSPPKNDRIISSKGMKADIKCLSKGPIYGTINIRHKIIIPQGLSEDGSSRSKKGIPLEIDSDVILAFNAKRVEIKTRVHNQANNHLVRVLFPTGTKSKINYAEEQFGVIYRPNELPQKDYWESDGWVENPLPIYPQQTFVGVHEQKYGLAILNRDLTEYEVLSRNETVIALTLLRSVGALGRPDLTIRPGRASGLEVDTPDALCHGDFEFEYAIYPHSGDYSPVGEKSATYNSPLQVVQANRQSIGKQPWGSFLEITPKCLISTCIKKAEREEAFILRVYNSTSRVIDDGRLIMPDRFKVKVVDLKEDPHPTMEIKPGKDNWKLPAINPNQILTLMIFE